MIRYLLPSNHAKSPTLQFCAKFLFTLNLVELLIRNQRNSSAPFYPGYFGSFHFQHFPCFHQWNLFLKGCGKASDPLRGSAESFVLPIPHMEFPCRIRGTQRHFHQNFLAGKRREQSQARPLIPKKTS